MTQTHFQIVTADAEGNLASQTFETPDPLAAFEVRGYKPTGHVGGNHLREELRGQPKFHGLLGPMWGGFKDGAPVIRYEGQAAYDILSE